MKMMIKRNKQAYDCLFTLIPVIIFLLMAFTHQRSGEFISEGTFQTYTEPEGWWFYRSQTDYKVGTDSLISQHGNRSAFLESVVENPESFITLMQTSNVKEYRGKRVKMTGYIRSVGTQDTSTMWLRIDDYDSRITSEFDNMWDRPVTGNSDWTKCEIVFDVPNAECVFNYGVILAGAGKAWFDNVSFEIVDSLVEKTTYNLNQELPQEYLRQFEEQYPQGLPEKAPENLDFEE
jgi:hypothetical protein